MILACIEHHTRQFIEAVKQQLADAATGFSSYESGDYLRCAGSDGLAEALGRMECDGPDAAGPFRCVEHGVDLSKCAQMPHAEGDEWNDEPVCYFCDRPTERTVVCTADFDTEYVCEKCAHIAQSPAAHGVAADGPAEACDILQSPSAGHPIPIERDPMYLALRIAEVAEGVPLTTLLTVAQVLINKGAQAVVASRVAEDAPQQIETGHDMGGRWAAETFPQHTKHTK